MADGIMSRVGEFFAKRVPTETLGTSRETSNVLTGEGAGTFEEPGVDFNLTGARRFELYNRMVRDTTIVGAGVRLFLNLISNAVWTVNPPEDLGDNAGTAAQDYADQAYDMLFDMTTSWSAIVRKTAAFRFHGFAIQEWTAKKNDDGTIGLLDIEHRPQKTIARWNRDEGGTVESVVQAVSGRQDVTLPRSKIVYAVDDTLTDSPEGLGLFRHMIGTSFRLEEFLTLEEVGFTTDLRGIPIARAPLAELQKNAESAGAPGTEARKKAEAARTAMLRPLRTFLDKHVRNEKLGALLPSDTFLATGVDKSTTPSSVPKWSIELLNGDSQSFADMANAINRMNQELARILGVEHLLLGADGGGSLALAKSKVGTFYLTVTSTLLDLVEIYDRDVIAPWAELNGVPDELRPQMGVNEISDRDIAEVMDALTKLATAGAPILAEDPAVGEVYDLIGLTRPPERTPEQDLSLHPERQLLNDPNADPNAPEGKQMNNNPEDGMAKAKVLRGRNNRQKAMKKRRQRAW